MFMSKFGNSLCPSLTTYRHIDSSCKPTNTGTTDSVNGISSTNLLSSLNTDHFTNTGKRIYIDGCRYNERLNTKTQGSKTVHIQFFVLHNEEDTLVNTLT